MTFEFTPATRAGSHLRAALVGPTGSGKTLTALKIASVLADRIAVIDTENDSARLFAGASGVKPFSVINLDPQEAKPSTYVAMIEAAANQGFDCCIVDSITPSWYVILDAVGSNVLRWKDVGNPAYNKLIAALLGYRDRMHIIATIRSKMELRLETDEASGKLRVTKHGMQPIQRDTLPYEFDIVGQLDEHHVLTFDGIGKQRCEVLDGQSFTKPGKELGLILKHWLEGSSERQ